MTPEQIVEFLQNRNHPQHFEAVDKAWRADAKLAQMLVSMAALVSDTFLMQMKSRIKLYIP